MGACAVGRSEVLVSSDAREERGAPASSADENFYTSHQAARLLGVTMPTIAEWCRRGWLPHHRTAGGHRRIRCSDLHAFAEARGIEVGVRVDTAGSDSPRRVLIVDEDRQFSDMIREYLSLKGYAVSIARTAFEAGMMVAQVRPELVVFDVRIAELRSVDIHQLLRVNASTRGIPILASTAYGAVGPDEEQVLERFDDVIEKPLPMARLLQLVEKHLVSGRRGRAAR
jgi:excisionase family DNA binding protein